MTGGEPAIQDGKNSEAMKGTYDMTGRQSSRDGLHLKAARALAGMKQTELAQLAGLHVNSLKRLERARYIHGSDHAMRQIGLALRSKGVIAEAWPLAMVRLADKSEQ